MTYRQAPVVEVWAWGARVGAVAADPSSGRYVFAYAPEWVASGVELSPLLMPLRARPYDNSQWPSLAPDAFHGLVPLLADSLPDAFGNALVDAWMAEHGVPTASITPLDRLAYAADRAMGALEFRPPAHEEARGTPTGVALADLVLAARLTVRGELAEGGSAHAAIQQLIQVGSSAGGARAKAVINLIRLEAKGFVAKLFRTITWSFGPTTPNLILVPPTSTPTTYFFIKILNFTEIVGDI